MCGHTTWITPLPRDAQISEDSRNQSGYKIRQEVVLDSHFFKIIKSV